jgi:hypothetical protein
MVVKTNHVPLLPASTPAQQASIYFIYCGACIYYCTVRYSIMARIKLFKNPQSEANKSANRWGILRAKGGVVPPSVFN